jgi:co-chaperonin GroES (HSP10)
MANETLTPQHDWIVLEKIDFEEKTSGGLVMPKPGDYDALKTDRERRDHRPDRNIEKNKSRDTFRGRVLAVGPGSYVDVADAVHDNVFLRKPMCCAVGDIVLLQGEPPSLPVGGAILYMAHDYQILATVDKDALEPQNDYIFCKPANVIRQSTGGIYMPTQEDQTGNRALPDRWEALGVGRGPWALQYDTRTFERRPMCVKPGDVFTFEGAGFLVAAAGAPMCVVQNYQVAGVFSNG